MGINKSGKIAIFGGTFNPIHLGHLVIADCALAKFALDEVVFIPAKEPPHKDNTELAAAEHRYQMVSAAIMGKPYFKVSREELERTGPSYSVDTLKSFRAQMGGHQDLYFIIGADAILDIFTWKRVDKVMELCFFLAATRPGYPLDHLLEQLKELPEQYQSRIFPFEIPHIDISSTSIRSLLKNNRPIKYLVPEAVEKYIFEHNLYL